MDVVSRNKNQRESEAVLVRPSGAWHSIVLLLFFFSFSFSSLILSIFVVFFFTEGTRPQAEGAVHLSHVQSDYKEDDLNKVRFRFVPVEASQLKKLLFGSSRGASHGRVPGFEWRLQ